MRVGRSVPRAPVHFGFPIVFAFGIQDIPFKANGCLLGRALCPQSAVLFGTPIVFAFGMQDIPFEVNGCLGTDSPTLCIDRPGGRALCPQSAVHSGLSIVFAFGMQHIPFEVNGCLGTDSPNLCIDRPGGRALCSQSACSLRLSDRIRLRYAGYSIRGERQTALPGVPHTSLNSSRLSS